ncbi:transcription factor grauzone-like [Lucilia sericata]|uniref:transcription factor grauzone-like n=1 Tax=Lucilia sericata TaxID=13632 RepID=UPI0018A808E6|nr:transcription factor grauzone-like [Lucilia sericata]
MEYCLLCLEKLSNCIKVNSGKWHEQEIKFLIEKHLWTMSIILDNSWICLDCINELQNFNKFYERIKQAHTNLDKFVEKDDKKPIIEDDKDNESEKVVNDDHTDLKIETEIVMEQVMDAVHIKRENEDLDAQIVPINKKDHKEENEDNVKDSLQKTKKSKQHKIVVKNFKKLRLKNRKLSGRSRKLLISENSETSEVKVAPCKEMEKSESLNVSVRNGDSEANRNDDKCLYKRQNPDDKALKDYDRIIADNFQIECNLCQTSFVNFIELLKHFKEEHKQRGYALCCNRKFFSRPVLVDHIYVHLDPEHFKCKECDKVFSNRSVLVNHLKIHKGESEQFKCDKCGKTFVTITVLRKHLFTHSSEKMFPCTICGKSFTNSSILNHHIGAMHQNKFLQICYICGKSLRCSSAFTSHMQKHEAKTTTISCDVCGLLLANKVGLKRHKNSQHPEGGKKDHKCQICLKISPTLRALKAHIQRTHELGYNYKCSLCEKAFKQPAVLKAHMAIHTGIPLYSCPFCPKTFHSNSAMYYHRKNAHPKEWEELQRQKYVNKLA